MAGGLEDFTNRCASNPEVELLSSFCSMLVLVYIEKLDMGERFFDFSFIPTV